jgi:mono/diheme cytochrome c family protein
MKRMLFTALTALTILAAAFFVVPSSNADGLRKSKASVTFNKDVAPILFKSCAECHRPGEVAPMSLLSYKDARPWARSIREKVVSREMPPWHADPHVGQFSNDPRLTQKEIDTITAWVDGGAKEGNPRDLPPAPKFIEGWGIGQPDLILKKPVGQTSTETSLLIPASPKTNTCRGLKRAQAIAELSITWPSSLLHR